MNPDTSKRYALRGVSASKEEVHHAIKNIDKGLFPKPSVKLLPII
jgi:phosphoribosylformylglycinamidine cyclo-ligase